MPSLKLTQKIVDGLKGTEKLECYFDETITGFGVYTKGKTKTYFVQGRANGKLVKSTIGKTNIFKIDDARREAKIKLAQMSNGINPNEEKRKERLQAIENDAKALSLEAVIKLYFEEADLKPRTVTTYQDLFRLYLSDWLSGSVTEITDEMVKLRHVEIAKGERGRPCYITVKKTPEELEEEQKALELWKPTKKGQRPPVKIALTKRVLDPEPKRREAAADNCMRTLGAVLAFYKDEKDPAFINPVQTLSRRGKRKTKAGKWFKVGRRKTVLKSSDLTVWNRAVMALENEDMRDYLLFLLFTGLRRSEAARLKWKRVDLKERTFTVTDTKNREPHTLPMSDFLHKLFENRKADLKVKLAEAKTALEAARLSKSYFSPIQLQSIKNRIALAETRLASPYVFPGEGKSGYLNDPKRAINEIVDATGISFSCHDLRRTFETIAESLDLSKYALKALLNHKQDTRDVTAGYIILSAERLRDPMQRIANELLRRIENPTKLIDFEIAHHRKGKDHA